VQQQQVDERKIELRKALFNRILKITRREFIPPHLRGYEDLFTRNLRSFQAFSDLALIAIHLRGVDVAIALLQRRRHDLDARLVLQPHRAEAEGWNPGALIFNDVHAGSLPGRACYWYWVGRPRRILPCRAHGFQS
jgi:hypothetical protein